MELISSSLKKIWRALLVMSVMMVFSIAAMAQSTATINGTVTDQTGAVVPGAMVTVNNPSTGLNRSLKTDESGHYSIGQLQPGVYDITVSMTGFATIKRIHQELFVGTTITMDFPLNVSTQEQTVEVSAVSSEIERTQTEVVGVLDPKQLDDLPIQSRNFSEMASLTPGVATTSQVSVGFAVGGAVTGVTIGNSTQYATGYTVDDVPINKPSDGGLYVAIAQDWVQEFSVTTNNPPAEIPGAISGYVNAITRTGTNNIHGRAYAFFQNSALNASNTNPAVGIIPNLTQSAKAPTSSQRVGGMIGGPIFKDKLFYFAGYEYFRSLAGVIYSGLTGPSAVFSGSRGTLPGDETPRSISNLNRQDLAELKATYTTQKDTFNVTGYLQQIGEPNIAAGGFTVPENGNTTRNGDYQESLTWAHTFSPSVVNNFRFSSARDWDTEQCTYASIVGAYSGPNTSSPNFSQYGTTPYGSPTGYYAQLTYPGNNGGSVVTGCNGRWGGAHFVGLYGGFYDTVSVTKGRHSVKFGGHAADPYYGSNGVHSNFDGLYGFSGTQARPFNPMDSTTFPLNLTLNWQPLNHSYVMATGWNFGMFAEDSWRVSDNLTVNLGLRWDGDLSYSYFNKHELASDGQPVDNDFRTVSPRVGISATPFKDKSTILRASFGLFYGPTTLTEVTGYVSQRTNPLVVDGFVANLATSNPYCSGGTCTPQQTQALEALMAWSLQNNTIPDLALTSVNVGGKNYALPGFTGTIPKSGAYNIDPNLRKAATTQSTVGVSKDFGHGLTATADFAFSYGFDLDIDRNININPYSQVSGTITYLNPNYTSLYSTGSLGWYKNYQLLTKVRYRDQRGDFAQMSYTLGKAISNSPGSQDFTLHQVNVFTTNPFNLSVDDGPANTDQRHILAINGNGKLPGDVEIAPIFTFSTGTPLTPTTTQQAGAAATSVAGTTNIVTVPGCQKWYNQCYPAVNGQLYTKGSFRGANSIIFSARVQRPIHLGGTRVLMPMFEAYNIPNHVNIGTNYQMNTLNAYFGKPTSSSITMRQLQLGVRFDF